MIPVSTPYLAGNEKNYLAECIDSGWVSSDGPFVTRFEQAMASTVQRQYGVACANGTAALDLAVRALDLQPGDEVILPAFTIISCVRALVLQGLRPVLVDSCPRTFNMQAADVAAKISAKTKAILIVHLYGLCVDLAPILALAQRYQLKVIEDAAEVLGQHYRGVPCGSFGDISVFSFYANKQVTTGEGGMVLTNDPQLAERCRSLRNLAFSPDPARRFIHEELGWNYRMTNLQAALGVAQLENLSTVVALKRQMGARYQQLLADLPGVNLPLTGTDDCQNIYWVFTLTLQDEVKLSVPELMAALAKRGIGSRPFFYPLHLQPVFAGEDWACGQQLPHAEWLYRRGLYLPSGAGLTAAEQQQVAAALFEVLQ